MGLSNKFPVLKLDFVLRLDTSDDSAAFVRACALGIVAIANAIAGAMMLSRSTVIRLTEYQLSSIIVDV